MKRQLTEYTFRTDKTERSLRLAVAADIHSSPFDDVLEEFTRCDAVLIPGDLVDRHRRNNTNAYRFLEAAPECAPVFYSIGNHERKFRDRDAYSIVAQLFHPVNRGEQLLPCGGRGCLNDVQVAHLVGKIVKKSAHRFPVGRNFAVFTASAGDGKGEKEDEGQKKDQFISHLKLNTGNRKNCRVTPNMIT